MALYRRISDILLMAMEKGMTVWSSVEFEEEAFFEGLLLLEPPT